MGGMVCLRIRGQQVDRVSDTQVWREENMVDALAPRHIQTLIADPRGVETQPGVGVEIGHHLIGPLTLP